MKILQITSLYPPNVIGGAEQSVKVLSEQLVELGHELHVATLRGPEMTVRSDLDGSSVHVHGISLANIYWPFNGNGRKQNFAEKAVWHAIDTCNEVMARRISRLLDEIQPDVVFTHNLQGFSTAVMPAVKRSGVYLVHVIHDYSLLCPQTALFRNGSACGLCDERCRPCRMLSSRRHKHTESVDAVVAVSDSVLRLHRKHGLFEDIPGTVIYNALKPEITIRKELPERDSDHVFTFGYLGRIEQSKGVETLLNAAQTLKSLGRKFKLLIAGRADTVYLEYLQATFPFDYVEYVGFVKAGDFLRQLDALVFPSEWMEALGNGVFEAFACATPVIGSDVGGIPESIDHGNNGLIFEAGNSKQLASCMLKLESNPPLTRALAAAALEKSHQYLAPNRAREFAALLNRISTQNLSGTAS